jgi:LacI family transcriptional regulator
MPGDKLARIAQRRSVTIADVARAAGVHPSTVSRSLDPDRAGLVSPDTRARVIEAAEALRYQPDLVAKGLRNQRTHTLGIIVPDLGNPVWARLIRGVNSALDRQGYMSLVSETPDEGGQLDRTLSLFSRRRVDAVIVASPRVSDRATLRRFVAQDIPVVMAVRWIRGVNIPIVANDDRLGGELAAQHLIDLGHERVAQLRGPADIETFVARGTGFRDAFVRAGLDIPTAIDAARDPNVQEGRRLMTLLLGAGPNLPTAVFAHNDLMAIGAIEALAQAGRSCPADVSIIGYNDIPLVEHLNPPLSTIRMPVTEVGRVAAETALALAGELPAARSAPVSITLQPTLVVRGSTAPRDLRRRPSA